MILDLWMLAKWQYLHNITKIVYVFLRSSAQESEGGGSNFSSGTIALQLS